MATAEASTGDVVPPPDAVSSFAKSLFLGEIHGDMVFPYPCPGEDEERRIRDIVRALEAFAEDYDERATEEARWVSDEDIARLGEIGALGLYVPPELGGQGLSQTGYARVFEAIARIDPTLSVVLGVHQSIGYKGIALFGTSEQKSRWLPDLATGASWQPSRSRSPTPAPTPGTSSRARSGRPTAPGCSTARSATSATARAPTSSRPSRAARSMARTGTSPCWWRGAWRASRSASATTRWACAPTTCGSFASRTCGSPRERPG